MCRHYCTQWQGATPPHSEHTTQLLGRGPHEAQGHASVHTGPTLETLGLPDATSTATLCAPAWRPGEWMEHLSAEQGKRSWKRPRDRLLSPGVVLPGAGTSLSVFPLSSMGHPQSLLLVDTIDTSSTHPSLCRLHSGLCFWKLPVVYPGI